MQKPPAMVLFFLALSVASAAAVVWGISAMPEDTSAPSAAGAAAGAGGAILFISLGMLYLTINGWRKALALARGEGLLARWTVSPEDYAAFVAADAARNALGPEYGNDWTPPQNAPPGGLEVVFGKDIVSVGDRAFGLVNTGMFTFEGVQMLPENPLVIEFGTKSTTLSHGASSTHVDVSTGLLRIPVGRLARDDAMRVLRHYQAVDAHTIVVNPEFYEGRKRFGLIAAPICFIAALIGYALQSSGITNLMLNLILMVGGIVAGIGALVLAAVAAYLGWQQRTPL